MNLFNLRSSSKLLFISMFSILLIGIWAITPATAHCGGNHTGNHPHCSGGGGTPNAEIIYLKPSSSIMVANADGSNQSTALSDSSISYIFTHPSWTSDGNGFLFAADFAGAGIYFQAFNNTTGFADGDPQLLTTVTETNLAAPKMSPGPSVDGNVKIVFADQQGNGTSDLFLMNSDGSNVTRLTPLDGASDVSPRWSPYSDQIVVLAYDSASNQSIQVIDLVLNSGTGQIEEGGRTNLTVAGVLSTLYVHSPVWSPDGGSVMVSAADSSNFDDLYLIPVANPALATNITNTSNIDEKDAIFSPDGTQILHRVYSPSDPCPGGKGKKSFHGLALRNADGSPIGSCEIERIISSGFSPDWR